MRNPHISSTDWVPPNLSQDLLAASVSGAVCCVLVNPFWVLKLRMITSANNSSNNNNADSAQTAKSRSRTPSMIGALRSILQNEGPKAYVQTWKIIDFFFS